MTGLPTIVALAVLNGVLVATSFASLSYSIDTRARAIIAEANLQQAERKWMACHESGIYTVGEDVPNVEFSGTPAALSPEAPLERRVGGESQSPRHGEKG